MQTEAYALESGQVIEPAIGPEQSLEISVAPGVQAAIVPETTVKIHQGNDYFVVLPGQSFKVSGDFRVEHNASCHSRLLIRALPASEVEN